MEHIIDTLHGVFQGRFVAHVANVKLDFVGHFRHTGLEIMAHIVLFLLVAAEDADFAYICSQKAVQHCIAEAACTSGDKESFIFKYAHFYDDLKLQI